MVVSCEKPFSVLRAVTLAPGTAAPEERALAVYFKNLTVTSLDKSRVIAIDFSSTNRQLAADVANAVAAEYIARQREAKRLIQQARVQPMAHALPAEREAFADLFHTADQHEGVSAFLEKRPPVWKYR